jgi:predicted acyl esterase
MGRAYNAEAVRWYDHWLKGVENGIMDEPPIRIHVRASGFRAEHEWPLARTEWMKFYLRRWNGLSPDPEPVDGYPDSFLQQPPQETSVVQRADYLTPALLEPMQLIGPAALYLHAAIDAEDTNWIVALADIAPDGSLVELTRGYLKASPRAIDTERSTLICRSLPTRRPNRSRLGRSSSTRSSYRRLRMSSCPGTGCGSR